MSQKHADGPASSGGHRYGYRAAAAAGVPMGWALRQPSPEQMERRARDAKLDAEVDAAISQFPALSRFRQDEWGRKVPGWWLAANRHFLAALAKERDFAAERDKVVQEKNRRRSALEAAIVAGHYRP